MCLKPEEEIEGEDEGDGWLRISLQRDERDADTVSRRIIANAL